MLQEAFLLAFLFCFIFFSLFIKNVLPALGGKHDFEKRRRLFSIKKITFLTPKRHLACHFLHLFRTFVALLFVRFALCSFFVPFKKWLWSARRAVFGSGSPLRKRRYKLRLRFLQFRVQSAVFFLRFLLDAPFFFKFLSFILKKCFLPRVGSMILQNKLTENLAKGAYFELQNHLLVAYVFFKKP